MKKVKILNVEENKKYIDEKDYIIKGIDNEVEYETRNPKLDLLRLWIEEEFPFEIANNSMEFIFENKVSNTSFTSSIIEKGIDNDKHYVIAYLEDHYKYDCSINDYHYESKIFDIALGDFELDISFSPEMIINGDKLYNFAGVERWPSFHDAKLKIIEYSKNKTILRFYEAIWINLPDDKVEEYVIDLIITDIVSEDYTQRDLEYFANEWISGVKFAKKGDYMEVMFCNDYGVETWEELELEDGLTYERSPRVIERQEVVNHAYITCKNVEVDFYKIQEET